MSIKCPCLLTYDCLCMLAQDLLPHNFSGSRIYNQKKTLRVTKVKFRRDKLGLSCAGQASTFPALIRSLFTLIDQHGLDFPIWLALSFTQLSRSLLYHLL